MTCYSLDLRKRVLMKFKEGMSSLNLSKLFNLSRQTIYNWLELEKKGNLKPKNNCIRKPKKIPQEELEKYVLENPDATLKEMAKKFNCSTSSVFARLSKSKVVYKKKRFCMLKETRMKEQST